MEIDGPYEVFDVVGMLATIVDRSQLITPPPAEIHGVIGLTGANRKRSPGVSVQLFVSLNVTVLPVGTEDTVFRSIP